MKLKLVIALLCSLYLSGLKADYLTVSRIANLREDHTTASEVLEKLKVGDSLILLSDEIENNYYYVRSYLSGQEGWVYRNLVAKQEGELPEPAGIVVLEPDAAVVDVRVLDVGAGLCTLIKLPGNKYVIYDAGGIGLSGDLIEVQIKEYIPEGSTIELMVLSHTDADHINAADNVLENYNVKKVIWGGYEKSMASNEPSTQTFQKLEAALENSPGTQVRNLHEEESDITPGEKITIGNAKFIFLCGFGQPPAEWDDFGLNTSEKLNAVSIIMKLEYAGQSILFCGDGVGRHLEDPEDALIATEAYLLEHAASYLPSTVVIAPHHGAKNGSSSAFVDAVQPEYVVFSAGHKHKHPSTRTANQYKRYTTTANIFRTDRGDDEGGTEWTSGRIAGCQDDYYDDTIQIQLRANQSTRVFYITPNGPCGN